MIWLVLGPSGVGKSSFGQWLNRTRGWLHVEIDAPLGRDGIADADLRAQWDEYYERFDASSLAEAVNGRLRDMKLSNAVMSFSSMLVLEESHVDAAMRAAIRVIYLWASEALCRQAFLAREQQTGSGLGLEHWEHNNVRLFREMAEPSRIAMLTPVYREDGTRLTHAEVFGALSR